jgi:Flp pilus assembly protein TadG
LIEVLIALFLLMIGLMALLYTVSISISANLQNVLRDEAVAVASQQMAFVRNVPFDQIPIGTSQAIGLSSGAGTVSRSLRNTAVTYTVVTNVASMTADSLSVQVIVSWSFKGSTVRHSVTTMVPRGT